MIDVWLLQLKCHRDLSGSFLIFDQPGGVGGVPASSGVGGSGEELNQNLT